MGNTNKMVNFDKVHIRAGLWSGVIGGVVFGALMGMMGMLPMVGMLVNSENAVVGFILHIIISAIIGIGFGIFFGHAAEKDRTAAIGLGLAYGFIWWILGPLVLMPSMMGMGLQLSLAGSQGAIGSLWGHLLFGFFMGLFYSMVTTRTPSTLHQAEAK